MVNSVQEEKGYNDLFSRNLGILTDDQQKKLKNSCVAIAGVGGVGGIQLINLVRSGIGCFHIADPEKFNSSDRNRQYGALESTFGNNKAEVMEKMIKDINPECVVKCFNEGVHEGTLEEFVKDADVVIDAIEYFTLKEKCELYQLARQKGKVVFTSPILGFRSSLLAFTPTGMTFEDYFEIKEDQNLNPLKLFHTIPDYLSKTVIHEALNKERPIPSFGPSAALSGALLASEVVFYLTGLKDIVAVPKIKIVDLFDCVSNTVDLSWSGFWSDFANEVYDNIGKLETNIKMLDRITALVGRDKNVLDAGCGTGNLTVKLAEQNVVSAIDFSDGMIAKTNEKVRNNPKVTVNKGDVTQLEFKNEQFEAITSVNVLWNVENFEKAIEEAYRVLKNNGMFVISSPLKGDVLPEALKAQMFDECKESGVNEEQANGIWKYQQYLMQKNGFKFVPDFEEAERLLESKGFKVEVSEKTYFSNFLIKAIKI